jgi:hypothetical protein
MRMTLRRTAATALLAVPLALCSWVPAAGAASTATPGIKAAPVSNARTARQHRMEAVVRAWSARLNAGDYAGIARLFTLPATLIQGAYSYQLVSRAQIAAWHSGLPCTGQIVSIKFHDRFATAVFVLGNRGSKPCDDPGGRAAARFEIVGGKIASWQQVPVPVKKPAKGGTVA